MTPATLKELQNSFTTALVSGDVPDESAVLLSSIVADGIQAAQRVQIHQNNFRESLTDSLAAYFPSVLAFVGEDYFKNAVRSFLKTHPPREAVLARFGDAFAHFLRDWPHAQSIPYIADLAELDYAIAGAQNALILDAPSNLAHVRTLYKRDLLVAQPFAHVVSSKWPVGSLWMVAAGHLAPEAVHIESGGQNALVTFRGGAVEVQMIDLKSVQFLQYFTNKQSKLEGEFRLTEAEREDALVDLWHRGVFALKPQ